MEFPSKFSNRSRSMIAIGIPELHKKKTAEDLLRRFLLMATELTDYFLNEIATSPVDWDSTCRRSVLGRASRE